MPHLLSHLAPRSRLALMTGVIALVALAISLAWPLSPSELRNEASVRLRITDREGGLLRDVRADGHGDLVALDQVAPAAVAALIAVEDRHFYRHPGIDPTALVRAAWTNVRRGEVTSGASTVTMQVARVLRARTRRGLWDKIAEMHLALRLELHLSKQDILKLWLNRVSFGNRAHGIENAARLYFGKSARDLSPGEAAFLVGLPQSPSRYNPFRNLERAQVRQRRVLAAMERAGTIDPEEAATAASMPLPLISPQRTFRAPHFVEFVLGNSNDVRVVEVRTTLDPRLQRTVEDLMRGHVSQLRESGLSNAAAIVLDNHSGDILAYVGSANFWEDATGGQNDGVRMLRQPGSALKPFTYAMALGTRRYTPASILPDLELQVPEAGGAFSPENYDKQFHGPVPLRQALASSYNVPAVKLARELGPDALLRELRAAGFTSLQRSADFYGVGLTLGNGEVRLMELARAYAGLARGGRMPEVRSERWRRSESGDTLRPPHARTVSTGVSPEVAFLITDILRDPEARAPSFGRGGPLELPFPCAVKTGTSKDYRDNWTVGYTPRHTVAVWAGNFDGRPMQWVSGISGAGPLLKAIFLELGSGGEFARPPGLVDAVVCPESGVRPGTACPSSRREVFLRASVPTDTCRVHQQVRIDRRSGLLAEATTPKSKLAVEVFTVYPPEYHGWMREHGLPLPPTVTTAEVASATGAPQYSDRIRIEYPSSGTTYEIDPVLRRSFQQLRLHGTAEAGLLSLSWWVDGERLDADFYRADWTLQPGTHHIEIRAVSLDGVRLRSRPSIITVAAPPEPVASRF